MKIDVLLHLFYVDMWDDIKNRLTNIKQEYNLYVNLVDGFHDEKIINEIKIFKEDTIIVTNENKGVAIGGFLHMIKLVSDSDLLLFIHTKKSVGLPDKPSDMVRVYGRESATTRGLEWHNSIMDGILKDENHVEEIIDRLQYDESCEMVGYSNDQCYVGPNEPLLREIMKTFNLPNDIYGSPFVDGCMFWVMTDTIKKYFTDEMIDNLLDITPKGYLNEPSINHVLERIFGYIINNEKKKIIKI